MARVRSTILAFALVAGRSMGVAAAGEREDALWLARFTQTSERMFALALERRDILALETNAVLFDVAIEQAGLGSDSAFSSCWRAAIALQGLAGHLLTSKADARQKISERFVKAYSESMPKCETLVDESASRQLSAAAVLDFPAPEVSELTQAQR